MKILYTVYFWLVIIIATLVMGPVMAVMLVFDRGRYSYYFMSHNWARLLVFMSGVKVKVEGMENLPAGPGVFMCNHQSYFDAISLGAFLPIPVRFVAKRVLTLIPVFGQLLWATGHVIINRSNSRQAFSAMDKAALKIKQGTSIFVFPEGTRSRDHKLGPFKKGGFVLAIKAAAPVVPISITGTQSMMPKGKFSFKRPELVRIRIGKPIATENTMVNQKERLMADTRKAMINGFALDTPEWKANHMDLEDQPPEDAA
jgi:1-acyl-sn-glycerol-3-phosphate acyltransferase